MNNYLLLNKKTLLIINIILGLFVNSCFTMEEQEDELSKEMTNQNIMQPLTKHMVDLQRTDRFGSISSFSSEFQQFAKDKEISYERAEQQKEHPELNISEIRAQIALIDLKISQIKAFESYLFDQKDKPHKNKKNLLNLKKLLLEL